MISKQTILVILMLIVLGCNKEGYNYDKYLKGKEIIYTGPVSYLNARPGDRRVQLLWSPSPDRSIVKYVIKYNNKRDSLTLPANGESTSDTVKVIIPALGEFTQDFVLYTLDAAGNRSVGQTLTAVKVYGPLYASSLRNRRVTSTSVGLNGLTLYFAQNTDTINVNTRLTYINNAGTNIERNLHRDSTKIILSGWRTGEKVLVRSSYIPVRNSIDIFQVGYVDTIKVN